MSGWLIFVTFLATVILTVTARGPICLHGTTVHSHHTHIRECWPWESCFAEHHFDTSGPEHYSFGCRETQECKVHINEDPQKRLVVTICDACCTGDICNHDICFNGTEPNRGLPCLQCTSVPSTISCDRLTYCAQGEVCYTQRSPSGPHAAYTMGCMRPDVCALFEGQQIENSQDHCHECCEKPGCNRDACVESQVTTPVATTLPPASDCWDLRDLYNATHDGVYEIVSPNGNSVNVRCDMTTNGGGWIVFQRRYTGKENFDRSYQQYKVGFGELLNEFWLGNEHIHELTKDENQRLRIDICDWDNQHRWAEYDFFVIAPDTDHFRLEVAAYHGTAGDALITGSGGNQFHNNHEFSTSDADHDVSSHRHCGLDYHSGWWFGDCFSANLNGMYNTSDFIHAGRGIRWRPWKEDYSFKRTEMKFRPSHVHGSTTVFTC